MSTSAAAHIPVLSLPNFKSLDALDPSLVEVLEVDDQVLAEPTDGERLEAEYKRGAADAEQRMRVHYETLLEQERENHKKLLEEERTRFDMREAANVSAAIERFLDVMEQRISYSLAKLLRPFLKEKITSQLVSSFADNLRHLTQDNDGKIISLRGPRNLVEQVMGQVPGLRGRIDTDVTDQLELVALFDETTIETRLQHWLRQLDNLYPEAD